MSKKKFSSKPSKVRKRFFNAPLHQRHKMLAAHLSPELRALYKRRSFPVRTGDVVRIMRGDFKGLEGKVVDVDIKRMRVFVEKATIKKRDGTEVYYPIHPSNLMIIELDLSDPKRKEALLRGG